MTRVDDVMLMAYVDGELDAATSRQIDRAVSADPALAGRARLFRESAALLRGAYSDAMHEPVPERLVAALGAPEPSAGNVVALSSRRIAAQRIVGWAVAASLATFVIGGGGTYWYMSGLRDSAQQAVQVASSERWLDNVASFYDVYDGTFRKEDRMLVDFKADDLPELTNWFSARLNRKLAVPDLSTMGFQPQGGRLLIINGRPAAQFLYKSESGERIGFVIASSSGGYEPARTARRESVNIVHWRNAGYSYALVGAIETPRLQKLADKAWRDLEGI